MTLATLQNEIEQWDPEQQDHLAACLSVLRLKRDPKHAKELDRRLDDKTPRKWLTLDQLKAKNDICALIREAEKEEIEYGAPSSL